VADPRVLSIAFWRAFGRAWCTESPTGAARAVPGHWEGDLIGGAKNSYVATLVGRHSRYVMLVKVANKDTESVVTALIKQSRKLPGELYQSLTWDRGKDQLSPPRIADAGRWNDPVQSTRPHTS
jgi:hypothetical protein